MGRADEPAGARVRATVACAAGASVALVEVDLPAGSTLRDAVRASGLGPDTAGLDLGVHGQRRAPDGPLGAGDRVEIYGSLTVDPKEARRIRAEVRRRRRAGTGPAR